MNKINVYSVYDKKGETFANPIYSLSDGVLIRDFRTLLRDRSVILAQYPEDYDLYYLGVFDADLGTIECVSPTKVISMIDILDMDRKDSNEDELLHELLSEEK